MRWTEKYRPKMFKDIIGNGKQKKVVETWVESWKNGKKQPPLLLVGPAGTGKTTFAHVIANEFSDFIELNASDKRSYDIIMNTVGESATTKSFFTNKYNINNSNNKSINNKSINNKPINDNPINNEVNNNESKNKNNIDYKLIILDEVDGIHGTDDRGGTRAIGKIIKESIHPIVMTANDFYSKRLTTIKTKTQVVKIGKVHTNSINALLKRICLKEGIDADPEAIRALALGSNGDMRSALNTLQALAEDTKKLQLSDLDIISQKDETNNIFDSVRRVLKSKSMDKVKKSLRLDEDPTLVMEYIAENIPREYEKPKELKKAYEMISEADLYFGRARQTRNYTYWRYASDFMGVGVAISKDETYKKFTKLTGSMAFSLMGRTRGKRDLRDRIAQKMSDKLHMSNSVAISMFPYMEIMFENDDTAYDIANFLDLADDEIKRFRKRKIPKSVIKRKEKEKLERIAKEKEKNRIEGNLKEPLQSSPETLSLDSKISTKSSDSKDSDKTTKSTKREESEEKNNNQSKEENNKEVKKESAQKSLFNF